VKARDEHEMIRPTCTSPKPTSRPSGASRVKVIDWPTPVARTLNRTSLVDSLDTDVVGVIEEFISMKSSTENIQRGYINSPIMLPMRKAVLIACLLVNM
jgi:hypothetical protein